MPAANWNLDWLAHNAQRAYPLAAGADHKDQQGQFTIPKDFLLSLSFAVHPAVEANSARFFIKHIGAYATGYSIVLGYQPSSGDAIDVAIAQIARQTHTRNQQYALSGMGEFADTSGIVVIGNLEAIDAQPAGFWTFDFTETRLEPDCILPFIRGITSIRVRNGADLSDPIYDEVELAAGANMQLVLSTSEGQAPVIRLNVIEGEGFNSDCGCDEVEGDPITRINQVVPDETGNIDLLGTECLQAEALDNGIVLTDTCAKPCCGDPELEKISEDVRQILTQQLTLEGLANRLQSSVDEFGSTVLGSRLSDQSCNTCDSDG